MYHLQTLGTLAVRRGGPDGALLFENSKSLALVAYLAARPERRTSRDHVADLFWPDADRSRARQSLRQALYYVQKKVGDRLVRSSGNSLVLRSEILEVDLWELDRALGAGEYERVVELYRGRFLASVHDRLGRQLETWVEARNEHVWTGVQAALRRLVQDALEEEDAEGAVRYAERYVRLNPLAESARRTLIGTLLEAGRPLEALRSYESYRTLLARELNDVPGPEVERLVAEIRERVFPPTEVRPDAPWVSADPLTAPGPAPEARRDDEDASPAGLDPEDWRPLAAAALILLLGAVVGEGVLPALRATDLSESGPVAVAVRSGSGTRLEIPARGEATAPFSVRAGGDGVPDPAGRRIAVSRRGRMGHDLTVVDVRSGERRIVTRRPHDENPETWSPDGRMLVYQDGWMGDDGIHYHRRLRILDLETGSDRAVSDVPVTPGVTASWAPSGAWIAFDGRSGDGDLDIWSVRPDGSDLRRLTEDAGDQAGPDWSPEGSWIAYASGPEGARDIFLKGHARDRIIPLVDTGFDDHSPVWRSESRLLFLSTRAGRTDVWEYDLDRDRRRRITHAGDIVRLTADPRRFGRDGGRWIDALSIEPGFDVVSPGQWLDLRPRGLGPAGGGVAVPEGAVVWSTATPGVVEHAGGGRFRIRTRGPATFVAAVPGWRTDTLRLPSRPVLRRPRRTLFRENWRRGIDSGRWRAIGDPVPRVVTGDERFGAALDPAGDAHFQSGLVTDRSFSTARGLTVEAWGRIPLTGRHYQILGLGLTADPPPAGSDGWGGAAQALKFVVSGSPAGARLGAAGSLDPFPPPDGLGSWHRYALQLHPDGRRSVAVDGLILWVEPSSTLHRVPRRAHVVVEGRTVGTDIRAGPLRIYEGVRYVVR